jgi:hypothetical protein
LALAIKTEPAFPAGLREAAAVGKLVPFVGAGASRLAGCPSWAEFADRAIDFLVANTVLNPAQRSQLAGLTPRIKLSLAKMASERAKFPIDYRSLLQRSDWNADQDGRRLYGHISALSDRFVTTNYDEWLDTIVPTVAIAAAESESDSSKRADQRRTILHHPLQITPSNFAQPNTVVHLHGALIDPAGMVLSTSDYMHRYATDRSRKKTEEENAILAFLEFLFAEKTVLFIGYGLDELEILEYIIGRRREPRTAETSHYVLQGFFSFEADLCQSFEQYYAEQCNVQLIPFSRDEQDYRQLIDVLGLLTKELPASNITLAQAFKEMEALGRD